jgi:hypothetical protein
MKLTRSIDAAPALFLAALLWGLSGNVKAAEQDFPEATGASIEGHIRVARKSTIPDHAFKAGDLYSSRAMRHAKLMDYNNPGSIVVYLDTGAAPASDRALPTLSLKRLRGRLIFERDLTLVTRGEITILNADNKPHLFYLKGATFSQRTLVPAAGEKRVLVDANGPYTLYVLDAEDIQTTVFVGGTHALRLDDGGDFEFNGLPAGHHALHGWHARFPPVFTNLTLIGGQTHQARLTLSVEHLPTVD